MASAVSGSVGRGGEREGHGVDAPRREMSSLGGERLGRAEAGMDDGAFMCFAGERPMVGPT